MASDIRETRLGSKLPGVRAKLDAEFWPRMWPARIVQMVIAAWLFASAFLWPHTRFEFTVTWIGGVGFFVLALISGFVPRVRVLLGLACIWFLLASFFSAERPGTILNNLFAAIFIFALDLLPVMDLQFTDWRGRPRVRQEA